MAGDDLLLRREDDQRHAEEDDAGPARPVRLQRPDGRRSRRANHDGGDGADRARNVLPHRQRAPGGCSRRRSSGRSRRSTSTGRPATEPPPNLTPNGPVPDLYTADAGPAPHLRLELRHRRRRVGRPSRSTASCSPIPRSSPSRSGRSRSGCWSTPAAVDHVFHIHQNDFAVIRVGSNTIQTGPTSSPYRYTSLRDTVDIPPGSERGHPIPRQPRAREVRLPLPHPSARGHRHDDGRPRRPEHVATSDRPRLAGRTTGAGASSGTATADRLGIFRPGARPARRLDRDRRADERPDEDIVAAPSTPGAAPFDLRVRRSVARADPPVQTVRRPARRRQPGNREHRRPGARPRSSPAGSGPEPSLVRIFKPDGTLVREIKPDDAGPLPDGASIASADFDGDNYDDVADRRWPRGHAPGGRRPERPRAQRRARAGRAVFALTAPGSATAGVNLAAGYYDPSTRPGFVANLITTPASGRGRRPSQVWMPFMPEPHDRRADGRPPSRSPRSASRPPHVARGLRLQVTGSARTGWTRSPHGSDPGRPGTSRSTTPATISRIQDPVTERRRRTRRQCAEGCSESRLQGRARPRPGHARQHHAEGRTRARRGRPRDVHDAGHGDGAETSRGARDRAGRLFRTRAGESRCLGTGRCRSDVPRRGPSRDDAARQRASASDPLSASSASFVPSTMRTSFS